MTPDQRAFREVVRTVTVDYPIPFLFASLLTFALGCFGLSAAAAAPISLLLAAAGVISTMSALVIVFYAILFRTDLLRSERHSLLTRAIDVMLDSDAPEAMRDRAGKIVDGLIEDGRMSWKRGTADARQSAITDEEGADG